MNIFIQKIPFQRPFKSLHIAYACLRNEFSNDQQRLCTLDQLTNLHSITTSVLPSYYMERFNETPTGTSRLCVYYMERFNETPTGTSSLCVYYMETFNETPTETSRLCVYYMERFNETPTGTSSLCVY